MNEKSMITPVMYRVGEAAEALRLSRTAIHKMP